MKRRRLLLVPCLAALIAGCSPMLDTTHDIDPGIDFKTFKSWNWLAEPTLAPDERGLATLKKYQNVDRLIRLAVSNDLKGKGVAQQTDTPELLVAYYLGIYGKMRDLSHWGIQYRDMENRNVYRESGVLMIDFIDPATNARIWRGTAHGALNVDPTDDMVEKNVNRAVTELLRQFPPIEDEWAK